MNLVSITAFDGNGAGSNLDVIRGLDWLVPCRAVHELRVVNLSFSAVPQSYYRADAINEAVAKAWQVSIVVVASSGNTGPYPVTIGVPGNNPQVITVDAKSDNFTPHDPSDNRLASVAAAGPIVEGFVTPGVVARGGHTIGIMDYKEHQIASEYALLQFDNGDPRTRPFDMSGTS